MQLLTPESTFLGGKFSFPWREMRISVACPSSFCPFQNGKRSLPGTLLCETAGKAFLPAMPP